MTRFGLDEPPRHFLAAGDRAPEFVFVGPTPDPLRSAVLLRQGPVLMTFYRGAWCACCQADLREL
jgi:peroxiredoxin